MNYIHDSESHLVTKLSCGDIDQKRKDLVVGTNSGYLLSFAIRLVKIKNNPLSNNKQANYSHAYTFQAIYRGKLKVNSAFGRKAIQIW